MNENDIIIFDPFGELKKLVKEIETLHKTSNETGTIDRDTKE